MSMRLVNNSGYIILVVEDDPIQRQAMVKVLRRSRGDFEVKGAESAENALRRFTVDDKIDFDVIIADFHLEKGMNGIEFMREWKRVYPFSKFILITGDRDPHLAVSATREGICSYITKPTNADELLSRVDEAISQRLSDAIERKAIASR
jgi:DNA-binding NtrC family response regulator